MLIINNEQIFTIPTILKQCPEIKSKGPTAKQFEGGGMTMMRIDICAMAGFPIYR